MESSTSSEASIKPSNDMEVARSVMNKISETLVSLKEEAMPLMTSCEQWKELRGLMAKKLEEKQIDLSDKLRKAEMSERSVHECYVAIEERVEALAVKEREYDERMKVLEFNENVVNDELEKRERELRELEEAVEAKTREVEEREEELEEKSRVQVARAREMREMEEALEVRSKEIVIEETKRKRKIDGISRELEDRVRGVELREKRVELKEAEIHKGFRRCCEELSLKKDELLEFRRELGVQERVLAEKRKELELREARLDQRSMALDRQG